MTDMSADPPELTTAPPRGRGLAGATVGMAIGTILSRITGVGRIVALTYALNTGGAADAYNLANTTPNMLYDIVLGGVLSATFIPVFVDRLANKEEREAFESISAVITVSENLDCRLANSSRSLVRVRVPVTG